MTRTTSVDLIDPRPVEWLWREHIPYGMMSIIAGHAEKGKSMLSQRIAADVSHEYGVIVSTYEEQRHETIRPRFQAAGANMENIHIWDGDLILPRDFKALRAEIEGTESRLLVLDPVSSHTSASIYHPTNIRQALGPLVRLGEDLDVATLGVHHIIKSVNLKADPLAAIGGSGGGLAALCRCAYLFGHTPDDEDERVMCHLKCGVATKRPSLLFEMDIETVTSEVDAPYLLYQGESKYKAVEIFTAQPKSTRSFEKMEWIAEWLVANLREGPMSRERILNAAVKRGYTKLNTGRTIKALALSEEKGKIMLPEGFPID